MKSNIEVGTVPPGPSVEAVSLSPPSNSKNQTENHQPIIAIASGKGGTGKTLVATSLALASDEYIQFLDCDVEEPNAYVFLKPQLQNTIPVMLPFPKIDIEKCTGCGKCAEFCEYKACFRK